jgi:hypothetical protein
VRPTKEKIMKGKSIRYLSVIVSAAMALSALAGACVMEMDDSADGIGEVVQAIGTWRLNVPVDRRIFTGNIREQDFYYTVGTACSPGFERATPTGWAEKNPKVVKLSGNGACDFVGWESPDPSDCRARIHAHTNAFWGGVECETSVFEEAATAQCCSAHPTQGCDNFDVASCVCDRDPFCCDNFWDSLCAAEVTSFGCGTCPTRASESCFVDHATPGCKDFSLASCVCDSDPYCCDVRWDGICVNEAWTWNCP